MTDLEQALRAIQEMALSAICETHARGIEDPAAAIKTLGGIYNYCETVLREGRRK